MTLTFEARGCDFDTQSIQVSFVLHLKKTLYGKFLNRVCVAYTILNLLEKRKQQLGLYGHTKKINCKRMIKTVLDNFFLSNKNFRNPENFRKLPKFRNSSN